MAHWCHHLGEPLGVVLYIMVGNSAKVKLLEAAHGTLGGSRRPAVCVRSLLFSHSVVSDSL